MYTYIRTYCTYIHVYIYTYILYIHIYVYMYIYIIKLLPDKFVVCHTWSGSRRERAPSKDEGKKGKGEQVLYKRNPLSKSPL